MLMAARKGGLTMKKIFLALMICVMFAGAGYCAPNHHPKSHGAEAKNPPPPPVIQQNYITVRRHKHHVPIYPYERYPIGTQVIVNTGGFSVGYGVDYGGGYVTYGGGFRL